MPARKIPLVWKTQKESDQRLFKYNPVTQRVVQVGCECVCPPPGPVSSVLLSNLTELSGDISFIYDGTETQFSIEIYESATLPVNTSGSFLVNFTGPLPPSGQTYFFTTTLNYYYVVGVRVIKDCGGGKFEYSSYVYSDPVQYTVPEFQILAFGAAGNDVFPKYYITGSYDASSWTHTGISGDLFTQLANDGAYDSVNQRWVAVGTSTPCALISDDNGLTWSSTGLTNFFLTNGTGIAHGNNRWVATGYFNPERLLTSTNGLTWSVPLGDTFGVGGSLGRGVAYNNGTWIAVGRTQSGGYPILRSTNGTTWTGVFSGSFEGYKVAYGNGVWIVVGEGANTIYRSTDDGLTWSAVVGFGFSTRGQGIAYNGSNRWVAVGVDSDYNIITSTDDGLNWSDVGTSQQYFNSNGGYDVLFKNNTWLACGVAHGGLTAIIKSSNATTWTSCTGDTFGIGSVFGLAST